MTNPMNHVVRPWPLSICAILAFGLCCSCSAPPTNTSVKSESLPSSLNGDVLRISETTSRLITIETSLPDKPSTSSFVSALGIATTFTDAKSVVNSRVRAKITSLPIAVGRSVTAGQIVAMLESEDLHNAQTSYRLAVERVKLAEAQLRRHKRLATLNSTTAQTLEDAISQNDAAETDLTQGNIDLSMAKSKVADLEAQLTQADIDRNAAARRLKIAETADSQATTLYSEQLISRVDRDRAKAQLADAEDNVRLSTAARSATLARLETSRLERDATIEKVAVLKRALERTSMAVVRARKVYSASTSMNKDVIEAQSHLEQVTIEMESAADDIQLLGGKAGDNHTIFIAAPISGLVTEQQATIGNTVDMNTPILTIVNKNKVGVTVNVKPTDIGNLRIGSLIRISKPDDQRLIDGAIMTIGSQVDETTGLVPVRVQLPAGTNLRQGTIVSARIPLTPDLPGLAVQSSAIVTANGKSLVFVKIQPDTYRIKYVTVRQNSASDKVIVTGLLPTEPVVITGANALLAAAESAGFSQ